MIVLGSNYRASGPPVYLPTSQAAADANTFVLDIAGGASANETGAGLGLAGADLVFTQVGGIPAVSGGYRYVDTAAKHMLCTVPFLQAFINGSEWSLIRKVKNITGTSSTALFFLQGTANVSLLSITGAYLGGGAGSVYPRIGAAFSTSGEYYEAIWKKNGNIHAGYVAVASGFPTGWESFPAGQRSIVTGVADFTADAWGTSVAIVGYSLAAATAVHYIGQVVASKIGLAGPQI